jgi:hypothetical protein
MLQSKSLIKIRSWWVKIQHRSSDMLAKYVNARGPFAEIVEAVYDRRSSRLSSVFAAQTTPIPARPKRTLALLQSLVISPRIEQMSIINA